MIKIRKAKTKDLNEIYQIYLTNLKDEFKLQYSKKIFQNEIENSFQGLNKFRIGLKSKNNFFLVLEDQNKIVGFGEATVENKKVGRIENLYINKNYRKNGNGTKILDELIKWLKSKEVEKIYTVIFIKNKPSIKTHKKLRFKPIQVKMELKIK